MKRKILIIILVFCVYRLYSLNFTLFFINFDIKEKIVVSDRFVEEIKNFYPINLYLKKISFDYINIEEEIITIDSFNRINYKVKDLEDIIENSVSQPYVSIFIINSDKNIGIGGNIGKAKRRVVIISKGSKKGTLSHELGHSLFDLGDEYGGEFSIKFSDAHISKYLNLSKTKPVALWEEIKSATKDEKIGYYRGGLGFSGDVYHSYPECLMNKLEFELCPVCQYLAIKKMNSITVEDYDFKRILNVVND